MLERIKRALPRKRKTKIIVAIVFLGFLITISKIYLDINSLMGATYLVLVIDENDNVEFAFYSDRNLRGVVVDVRLQEDDLEICDAISSLGTEKGIERIRGIVQENEGITSNYTVIVPDSVVREIYGKENIEMEDITIDQDIVLQFVDKYKEGEFAIFPANFTLRMGRFIPNSVYEYFSGQFFSLESAEGSFGKFLILIVGALLIMFGIGIVYLKKTRIQEKIAGKTKIEKTAELESAFALPAVRRYCSQCGGEVRLDDVFCSNCGRKVIEEERAGAEEKRTKLTCSVCKNDIEEGWILCPHCGARLESGLTCPVCKNNIHRDWVACPHCGVKLKDDTQAY